MKSFITPCLSQAVSISASGHGDPFASPYMMDVLSNITPQNTNMSFLLETNGVFFDEEHWKKIEHLSKYKIEIVVTINSFDKFTYSHISRGGNYEKLMKNLIFISKLRDEGKIDNLVNSMVVQDRNFREIPSFIKRRFEEYSFDRVVLKPVYQWGTMDEEVYWYKDVLNPCHPYHSEYLEILNNPLLQDSRVFNFGGDTNHEARPYPVKACRDLVDKIDKPCGSRFVIYGAGAVGKELVKKINYSTDYSIAMWVDKCFDGKEIYSPDSLRNMNNSDYDYIIIATKNQAFKTEIEHNLLSMGIKKEKIITLDE